MEHTFASQVARCLSHMHDHGYVHGDVKPLNIMRMGHGFKLIDLDASVSFAAGDFACAKFSSGFVPPECVFVDGDSGAACVRSPLCRVMVAADGALHYMEDAGRGDAGSDDGDGRDGEDEEDVKVTTLDFALVPSHPAQDMWAYGVVLYHMAAKCALFNCDFAGMPTPPFLTRAAPPAFVSPCSGAHHVFLSPRHAGNLVSDTDIRALAAWTDAYKAERLSHIADKYARNLVSQLLSKDPAKRPTVQQVLYHPFLSGKAASRLTGESAQYDVFISYRFNRCALT